MVSMEKVAPIGLRKAAPIVMLLNPCFLNAVLKSVEQCFEELALKVSPPKFIGATFSMGTITQTSI
ncbi:hypothetical protein ES288_D02G112900v1 [Gossypium darwinii]|uniref:Uncharacterized protein n=1 Tax=Gossypium darwinii TaxID=34276 RepID=A0A5D2DBU0_GOSDA|nr:hypothetical protein ES288_D02G112900v1 [Gossypium darwinii]